MLVIAYFRLGVIVKEPLKNTFKFTELVTLNLLKIGFNEGLFTLDGSGHISYTWHHSDVCRHSKVKLENNETDSIQLNRPGNI